MGSKDYRRFKLSSMDRYGIRLCANLPSSDSVSDTLCACSYVLWALTDSWTMKTETLKPKSLTITLCRVPRPGRSYLYRRSTSKSSRRSTLLAVSLPSSRTLPFLTCHVVEFSEIEPSVERDIFQRVQLGVALTTAGKHARIFTRFS